MSSGSGFVFDSISNDIVDILVKDDQIVVSLVGVEHVTGLDAGFLNLLAASTKEARTFSIALSL
jgi:hypothetical protein